MYAYHTDLRQKTREWALKHLVPHAQEMDASDQFPETLWPQLGQAQLLGLTAPKQWGGTEHGYLAQTIVMEEISRASASVGLSYAAHSHLCINQLCLHGNPNQQERYLPGLIQGHQVGALAMSEPDAGSDVLSMKTQAVREGNHYRLNGTKMWTTNGHFAQVFIVYSRMDPIEEPHSIGAWIIEKNTPGFRTTEPLNKLGMRGTGTCQLILEDCLIPAENRLGTPHQGVKILMQGLDYERVVLAAGPLGIMQSCLDLMLPYVKKRQQFGRAIGTFQLIQAKLADLYTHHQASQAYVHAVAQQCDQGLVSRHDAASVILFAAEQATKAALDTIQCLGGNGYLNDCPAGRLLRDAKLYEIGAGTSEIRRMLIGRTLQEDVQL